MWKSTKTMKFKASWKCLKCPTITHSTHLTRMTLYYKKLAQSQLMQKHYLTFYKKYSFFFHVIHYNYINTKILFQKYLWIMWNMNWTWFNKSSAWFFGGGCPVVWLEMPCLNAPLCNRRVFAQTPTNGLSVIVLVTINHKITKHHQE